MDGRAITLAVAEVTDKQQYAPVNDACIMFS